MSIDVDKMIKLIMAVLSNLIDDGWQFRIVDKYVDGILVLDDYGFCVKIGEKKTYVSPMYVIDLLIRSYYLEQDEFVYMSYRSFFEIDYQLSKDSVYNTPSWVRIVYFLKKIEQCKFINSSQNCINIDYVNFKKYLNEVNYSYFEDVLMGLECKKYIELTNLNDIDYGLLKKVESLYYLEAYLIQYIKDEIEDEIVIGDLDKQGLDISFEDYKVELVTFFKIIKERNDFNILENDIKWLRNSYLGRKDFSESLFGFKSELLPSSLEATVAFDNYSLRKSRLSD